MHILENEVLSLAFADKGAELSRVRDKELGCERLWSADPAVWNRHAPILFPFVGKVVDGQYRLKGKSYAMKTQHGFARDLDFACLEESEGSITQALCSTAATREIYPFDFRLLVRHRLDEENPRLLHIQWEVTNTGEDTMYYAIGGHPGFLPPAGVKKEDCFLAFPGKEKLRYISADPAGFALPEAVHELTLHDGAVPYGETLPETWIFEGRQVDAVQLLRPDKRPWVTLHCLGQCQGPLCLPGALVRPHRRRGLHRRAAGKGLRGNPCPGRDEAHRLYHRISPLSRGGDRTHWPPLQGEVSPPLAAVTEGYVPPLRWRGNAALVSVGMLESGPAPGARSFVGFLSSG